MQKNVLYCLRDGRQGEFVPHFSLTNLNQKEKFYEKSVWKMVTRAQTRRPSFGLNRETHTWLDKENPRFTRPRTRNAKCVITTIKKNADESRRFSIVISFL